MEQDARGRRRPTGRRRVAISIPVLDPTGRSPNSDTCPFFRSIDATGALRVPFELPHDENRCVAVAQPTPQATRQQQLVCLTSGHLNCPRYLRGALVVRQATPRALARPSASAPILAAAAVLVLSAVASVGFLVARGGMALALPSNSPVAAASASPSLEPTPSQSPSLQPTPASPSPTPSSSAPPSPAPATPSPTAAPPSPTPTTAATPAPTSDRYAVLDPCPDSPDCWIYTVRPGDNFQSIVNWFGVSFDTVVKMNPQLGDVATIHAGDRIRIPSPTR